VIGRSKRGGDSVGGAVLCLDIEEGIDGFFELSSEQLFVSIEWNGARGFGGKFFGKMEAVDGLEEKDGANPVVEVVGLASEGFQFGAFFQQGGGIERSAGDRKRLIAGGGVFGGNE